MTNIKYTSDGRKVAVIGSLNAQESIVQEIFIVNGQEVPSGENFVVKSLHDEPCESWAQKQLREATEKLERIKKLIKIEDDGLVALRKQVRNQSSAIKDHLNFIGAVLKESSPESFDILLGFLNREFTHYVVGGYSPTILDLEHFDETYDGRMRALSLYGKTNGTMTAAIGEYYDYSGSYKFVTPCRSLDEAKEKLREIIMQQKPTMERVGSAKQFGIELPIEFIQEAYTATIESKKKTLEQSQSTCNQKQEELNVLVAELESLAR